MERKLYESECKWNPPHTHAIQHSDQMTCTACMRTWDVNDPSPPPCIPETKPAQVGPCSEARKDAKWRGAYKVVEEAGELLCEIGKLGPFPSGEHPDGKGDLRFRLHDEIADLEAALAYFKSQNNFDEQYIAFRKGKKLVKFCKWGLSGLMDIVKEKEYGK